jgi:hypothetical protein
MKLKKEILIPLAIAIFALIGLELQVLPYIPFGGGRWIDSISKNTSNRSIEVRGDVNITGSYKINGSDLGAAAVNFDTIYSRGKDSTKFLTMRNRDNTANIETANLTANGTFTATGDAIFNGAMEIDGLMKNGANDLNTYNYIWKGIVKDTSVPYFSQPHGLTKKQYQNIKSYNVTVYHDTAAANWRRIYTGHFYGNHNFYVSIDSANIQWEGVVNLRGDSAFIHFVLTDYPQRYPY